LDALQTGQWDRTYDQLIAQKSAEISPSLLLLEKRGSRLFKLWSRFIAGGSGQPPGHPARLRRARMLLFLIPLGAFILGPIMAIISKIRILFAKRELESEVEKYIDKKPVS
ncbi:MAG: hypothetical protein KDC12_08915, partial [Flavobacteriales bacterium]|nr:hypothetical protein [Flavobacteriales bacterium]